MPGGTETSEQKEMVRTLVICVVLAVGTFCAFAQVMNNDFVNYDDDQYVTENPFVRRGLNAESVKWAFTTVHMGNWHPLTWISHILDSSVFGVEPAGHHLVSLVLHIANVVLLFLILKAATGCVWQSAFVAAVFGLHPLATESVAWVSQRKTILSTFFAFLTIAAYLWYVKKPGLRRYLAVTALFIAGLLAKPMLVTLPFVLLLLDFWPIGRFGGAEGQGRFWRLFAEKIPLVVITAVFCVVTYTAQAKAEALADIVALPLSVRVGNAIVSYVSYIGKIFYPAVLAVLYPLDADGPGLWQTIISFVLLASVTGAVIVYSHRRRYLVTGWFWYLGTLVPVIGLVQVGAQSMADRYVYLPGIGIYIMAAWLAGEVAIRVRLPKYITGAACVVVLMALIATTMVQVGYWRDSMSLCKHALAVTKDNYIMHNNCGEFLRTAGLTDEAIEHYRQALAINPLHASAYNNLGCALRDKKLFSEATEKFEQAIKIRPGYAKAHNNYGVTLAEMGLFDKAIGQFRAALTTDPYYSSALNNLCRAGAQGGKLDSVLEVIISQQQKTPDNAELYFNAGMIYGMRGNPSAATEQLEKALETASRQGRKELAGQIQGQLELYRQAKQSKE